MSETGDRRERHRDEAADFYEERSYAASDQQDAHRWVEDRTSSQTDLSAGQCESPSDTLT